MGKKTYFTERVIPTGLVDGYYKLYLRQIHLEYIYANFYKNLRLSPLKIFISFRISFRLILSVVFVTIVINFNFFSVFGIAVVACFVAGSSIICFVLVLTDETFVYCLKTIPRDLRASPQVF